jgi:transcriptional regulator with XRE-family HTH domain
MYLEQGLPTVAVNLSHRLRELRRRQGKTQSDISRHLGVDPSIPSLWEQGKRPVPPQRLVGLAEALEIPLSELLEGIAGTDADASPEPSVPAAPQPEPVPQQYSSLPRDPTPVRPRPLDRASDEAGVLDTPWVLDAWSASDRLTASEDELFEGLWLDPSRLDRPAARNVLRDRLCPADRRTLGDRQVSGAALADRILEHCSHQPDWNNPVPIAEGLFRGVLASELGGLGVAELSDAAAQRVPPGLAVTPALIQRLAPSLHRVYPVRWIPRLPVGVGSVDSEIRRPSTADT